MIITIANQKGGVGKTTTAVTLSTGLAERGYDTLLVDLDPQGQCARALGIEKDSGVYRLIAEKSPLPHVVQPARDNLHLVNSDASTERANRWLAAEDFRERVLVDVLAGASYDVVVTDLAPSLSILHTAALVAAEFIIIPAKLDFLAIDGINETLKAIEVVSRYGHRKPEWFVLPTMLDRVTKETVMNLEMLIGEYKHHVWPPIPQDVKLREAPAYGESVWEYAPQSNAVLGYESGNRRVGGYKAVVDSVEQYLG